jgi:hypothetical protein
MHPISEVEQPGSSVLCKIPYLQHVIWAMGDGNAIFKRLLLG